MKVTIRLDLDEEDRKAVAVHLGRTGRRPATRSEVVGYFTRMAVEKIQAGRLEVNRRIITADDQQLTLLDFSKKEA